MPMVGKRHSEETKEKMRLAHLGMSMSEEARKKLSESKKGHQFTGLRKLTPEMKEKVRQSKIGDKNPNWKGYDYNFIDPSPLHQWLRRRIPKPELCPVCKVVPPFDLANITGIYNREFKNWQYLCRRCHVTMDYKNGIRMPPNWTPE